MMPRSAIRTFAVVSTLVTLPGDLLAQTRRVVPAQPRPAHEHRHSPSTTTVAAASHHARGSEPHIAMPIVTVRTPRPPPPICLRAPVEVHRSNGRASWTGPLTDCDGRPTFTALAALSVLAAPSHGEDALPNLEPVVREIRRVAPAIGWELSETTRMHRAPRGACPAGQEAVSVPETANAHGGGASPRAFGTRTATARRRAHARPSVVCRTIDVTRDPHTHDPLVLVDESVRVLHPRLIAMLSDVTQHFAGHRVELISGYRPSSDPHAGSRHAHGRAMDFRVNGVSRESLRDFARTLGNSGVGYYPNSTFVHLDVRDPSEGNARWTDYSAHGETPRYGHWPPRDEDVARETEFLVRQAGRALGRLREAEEAPRSSASDTDEPPSVDHEPDRAMVTP